MFQDGFGSRCQNRNAERFRTEDAQSLVLGKRRQQKMKIDGAADIGKTREPWSELMFKPTKPRQADGVPAHLKTSTARAAGERAGPMISFVFFQAVRVPELSTTTISRA